VVGPQTGAKIAQPAELGGKVHIQRQGMEVTDVLPGQADIVQQMAFKGIENLEIALQDPAAEHAAQLRESEGTVAGDGLCQDIVAHGCHRLSLLSRSICLIVSFHCYTVWVQLPTRETLSS
jgi:hypothetical protein